MSSLAEWPAPLGGIVHDVPTSMDRGVAELWVLALRSGAYPQGRWMFRNNEDKFCPLGVLVDISTLVIDVTWEKDKDGFWQTMTPSGFHYELPPEVWEWADFKGMHGSQLVPLTYGDVRHPLYRLNDQFKLSFDTIAALIEAQYCA